MAKDKLVGIIDVTPTWEGLYSLYAEWIDFGTSEQKQLVKEELLKLCKVADAYNKITKAQQEFVEVHQD